MLSFQKYQYRSIWQKCSGKVLFKFIGQWTWHKRSHGQFMSRWNAAFHLNGGADGFLFFQKYSKVKIVSYLRPPLKWALSDLCTLHCPMEIPANCNCTVAKNVFYFVEKCNGNLQLFSHCRKKFYIAWTSAHLYCPLTTNDLYTCMCGPSGITLFFFLTN